MARVIEAPFIRSGDPDTSIETELYAPGELGGLINYGGRVYQKVRVHDAVEEARVKKLEEEKKQREEKEREEAERKERERAEAAGAKAAGVKAEPKAELKPAEARPKLPESEKPKTKAEPAPVSVQPIVAGDLAFWKDANNYVVTNDPTLGNVSEVAGTFRANVAGVFRNAPAPGSYVYVLQKGKNIQVKCGAATPGQVLVANDSANADALGVDFATARTVPAIPLGTVTQATENGMCVASVDIPAAI
jgi:hypothetical protein